MRRDILFKGKEKNTGNWQEGDYLFYSMQDFICKRGTREKVKIEPKTLSQYVGINTYYENEKEEEIETPLWEHDLLEIEYKGQTVITEVKYECGTFILVSDEFVDGYIPLLDVVEYDDVPYINGKVVGNVFDNPELLERNFGAKQERNLDKEFEWEDRDI